MNGAFEKNPKRRRTNPKASGSLGSAPVSLNEIEQKIWAELKRKAPQKVLTAADSFLVEIVSRLLARFRMPIAQCNLCEGKKVIGDERCEFCKGRGVISQALEKGELNVLMQGLSKLGFTPVDREKISFGSEKAPEENRFAKFSGA